MTILRQFRWLGILVIGVFLSFSAKSQVFYTEDFESGLGSFTANFGFISTSTINSCNGTSVRENIWSSTDSLDMSAPIGTAAGDTLTVQFDYKLLNFSGGTPVTGTFGTFDVQLGSSSTGPWTTIYTIDSASHTPSSNCATVMVSGISFPAGPGFIRIAGSWISGDYYVHLDDFIVFEGSAPCFDPSNLSTLNVTNSSATGVWTANNAGTSFEVEIGALGFTIGTGTRVAVSNDTFINVTGLTSATAYDWYVREICGAGDTSNWAGPSTFSTLPDTAMGITCTTGNPTTLFSDDFETNSGWTGSSFWEIGIGGATSSNTGPSAAYSGSSGSYMNFEASSGATGVAYSIVSPAIDLSPGNGPAEMSFWMHAYGAAMGTLRVGVGTSATGPFTNVFTWVGQLQTSSADPWVNVGVDLSTYVGQTIYLEFEQTDGSSFTGDMSIDLLEVTSCVACATPTALNTVNITTSGATGVWTSLGPGTNYDVQYGAAGFALGSGTIASVTDTFVNVTGLNPGTAYDWYVREVCGPGDTSAWAGPASFTTACPTLTAFTLPFIEGWETSSGTVFGGGVIGCNSSYNWSVLSSTPQGRARFGTDAAAASVGSGAITLDRNPSGATQTNDLILTLDMSNYTTATDLELLFDARDHGEEPHANDSLWIRGSDTDPWVGIFDLYANLTTTFQTFGPLDLDAALAGAGQTPGSTFQIRFGQEDNFPVASDGMSFDEIVVRKTPTCFAPTLLGTTNITTSTATGFWTASGPGTSFEVELGAAGFVPGTGTIVAVTDTFVNVTGLTPNTAYDWYVREICAPGDTSFWAGPSSFSTLCATFTAPLSENFDSTSLWSGVNVDPCWMNMPLTGFSWRADANGTSSTATGPADDVSGGGQYMYTEASSPASAGDTAWLFTPFIDMSGMTLPQANFWYHMYGGDMGSMHFEWQDSATGVWTNLWSQAGAVQTTNADPFIENNIILAPGLGTIRFRWVGVYGSGFNGDMAIDEFSITEAPTCPKPSDLMVNAVTTMSADISWTSNASGATWEIQYDTAGFVPGTGIFQSSTDTFATISGLMQSTAYDVYVREICGAGDTSTWLAGSFNTAIGNPSLCGINQPLPDGNGPNWFEIPIDASNASGANLGADVFVSAVHLILDHTYTSDVVMELVSPAGDTVLLFDSHGGSGDHFGLNNGACDTVLTFTDTASTPISSGTTPFIGPYAPDSALSGFNSGSPAGIWILRYQDNFGADQGTLQYIEIEFGVGNDMPCSAAELVVGAAPVSFTNEGTGFDAAEPTGSCWTDGAGGTSGVLDNTVWMYFVAPADAAYFVTTNFPGTPNNDTQIAAYLASNGCGDYAGYTEIGCGEDIDATNWLSEMTTSAVTAGDTVYVQVDGWAATVGQFDIQVMQVAPPSAGFTYTATNQTVAFTDTSSGNPTSWSWDFGDGNTSTAQNPSHTYASGGTYTVCLTASNGSGSDTTCESVMVVSGLNNRLEQFANVYPNPAKDRIVIEVKNETLLGYHIVDMMGRTILTSNENIVGTKEINVSDLATGNYIMRLNFGDEVALHKFIIQR